MGDTEEPVAASDGAPTEDAPEGVSSIVATGEHTPADGDGPPADEAPTESSEHYYNPVVFARQTTKHIPRDSFKGEFQEVDAEGHPIREEGEEEEDQEAEEGDAAADGDEDFLDDGSAEGGGPAPLAPGAEKARPGTAPAEDLASPRPGDGAEGEEALVAPSGGAAEDGGDGQREEGGAEGAVTTGGEEKAEEEGKPGHKRVPTALRMLVHKQDDAGANYPVAPGTPRVDLEDPRSPTVMRKQGFLKRIQFLMCCSAPPSTALAPAAAAARRNSGGGMAPVKPAADATADADAGGDGVAAATAGAAEDDDEPEGAATEGPWLLRPLARRHQGKKCLVLDLDETLVHSSFQPVAAADYKIPVAIDHVIHAVYVLKRPGVDEFLVEMAKYYEIVVYTASLNKYADPLLDQLDKHRVISARLFRESCVYYEGHYVKDLSLLGRELSQSIIVDNSPMSYMFQVENAIGCSNFIDDPEDTELWEIGNFLKQHHNVADVRDHMRHWREWCMANPADLSNAMQGGNVAF